MHPRRGSASFEALIGLASWVAILYLAVNLFGIGLTRLRLESLLDAALGGRAQGVGGVPADLWPDPPGLALGSGCDPATAVGIPPLDGTIDAWKVRVSADTPVARFAEVFTAAGFAAEACVSTGSMSEAEVAPLLRSWSIVLDGADEDLAPVL